MTDQFAYPPDREETSAKKAAALEALLIEKGVITPQTVDLFNRGGMLTR